MRVQEKSLLRYVLLSAMVCVGIISTSARAQMFDRQGDDGRDRGGDRGGFWRGDHGPFRPGPGWPHPGGPFPGPFPGGPRRPGPFPGPFPPPPMPPQGGPMLNIYRFYNGADHLLTLNSNEGFAAGYRFESVAFQTFSENQDNCKAALFRCFAPGIGHFASLDGNCEGRNQEGLLGFVASSPQWNAARSLVRCTNERDHLITTDVNECYRAQYRIESLLGFVP